MQIRRVLVDLIRRYVAYRVVIQVYRRFSLIDDKVDLRSSDVSSKHTRIA